MKRFLNLLVVSGFLCAALAALPLEAQTPQPKPKVISEKQADDLLGSVVRVKARALPDARSNATLGSLREGSGVIIDDRGYVLTIGYLVIEADAIEVTTAQGKTSPATLAGYDHATGFGLLRAATTGRTSAPPLFQTMAVLGKARSIKRIKAAVARLEMAKA